MVQEKGLLCLRVKESNSNPTVFNCRVFNLKKKDTFLGVSGCVSFLLSMVEFGCCFDSAGYHDGMKPILKNGVCVSEEN